MSDTDSSSSSSSSTPSVAPVQSPSPSIDDLQQTHPLQHTWTFFYNPPNKPGLNGEWSSNVKAVTEISTVEEFWRLFNALKSPSQLTVGSNYHMFKKGIMPEWEDEQNKRGGKWTITIQRRGGDPNAAKQADEAWLHSLLALIGEQFGDDSDDICGIVIGPRAKETRIALWTKGDDEGVVKRIGKFFKQNISYEQQIAFQLHDESIKKQTAYRNTVTFTV